MKNIATLITLLIAVFSVCNALGQSYTDWDDHDIIRFYEKVELESYSLDEEGEEIEVVYIPTKVEEGIYEIEVTKISSKLYQVRGTNIYMLFRFSPFLFTFDEGILEVSPYSGGTLYEKP